MNATKRLYLSIACIAVVSMCGLVSIYNNTWLILVIDIISIIINLWLVHRAIRDIRTEAMYHWNV